MRVDAELRSVKGVTLAEANMNFQREEQWFFSSEGAELHHENYDRRRIRGICVRGNEIQKRSYPNFFGGQWQNKGYELIDELRLVENARRIGEEAVALHSAPQCPESTFDIIFGDLSWGCRSTSRSGIPLN